MITITHSTNKMFSHTNPLICIKLLNPKYLKSMNVHRDHKQFWFVIMSKCNVSNVIFVQKNNTLLLPFFILLVFFPPDELCL